MTTTPTDPPIADVRVTAPVRIADVGGWTDTWFARRGAVTHLGVGPGVTVRATRHDGGVPERPVRLIAPDLGEDYRCGPSPVGGWADPLPGRHPLLEHAVAAVCAPVPPPGPLTVTITSAVPPGASLGTSASVVVALVAALECVLREQPTRGHIPPSDADRHRIAGTAHRIETVAAGREAGVQDQWAAAFGGAQYLEIDRYPTVHRHPIPLDDGFRSTLESNVVTVLVGRHDSSAVHEGVIAAITDAGNSASSHHATLARLADLADEAAHALRSGDLAGWADVATRSTRTQQELHDDLVGPAHRSVIAEARRFAALGWKVNGAGGNGGSVTTVFAAPGAAHDFVDYVDTNRPAWSARRFTLEPGLRILATA